MQYQQNFIPGPGVIGAGSARRRPAKNITAPAIKIANPNTETPIGTKRSKAIRNSPNMPKIPPEAVMPLYILIGDWCVDVPDIGFFAL